MSDIKGFSDAVNVFEFGADIGYKQNLQCIEESGDEWNMGQSETIVLFFGETCFEMCFTQK
jgi:hypothetical protein